MRVGRYACVDADWVGIARDSPERKMPETPAVGADLRLMFLVRAFGGDNLQSGEVFAKWNEWVRRKFAQGLDGKQRSSWSERG